MKNFVAICFVALVVSGCASEGSSKAAQGAAAGAAFGAGIGLLMGALAGKPERGLLAGAALGASRGAYEGWRQDQEDERAAQITAAIRESAASSQPATPDARAREELTRFLGSWTLQGWVDLGSGSRSVVNGRANGHVEMNYFVELAYIDLTVEGYDDAQVWGSTTFGYDEPQGYGMSTRFNTLPEPIRLSGVFDQPTRTFTYTDEEGTVRIRFENPDRFRVETTIAGNVVESYQFTRT